MTTERDIQFALRIDRLSSAIEAAEVALRELRAEYDDLVELQRTHLDIDGEEPRTDREWLGHGLVERARNLLNAPPGRPTP
jgi:hypothetical protein